MAGFEVDDRVLVVFVFAISIFVTAVMFWQFVAHPLDLGATALVVVMLAVLWAVVSIMWRSAFARKPPEGFRNLGRGHP